MTEALKPFEIRVERELRLLGIFAAWRLQAYGYLLAAFYAALLLSSYRAGGWFVHAGVPVYTGFTQQWIAARQALHGNIAVLYDPARLLELQQAVVGPQKYFFLNWPYPPTFLLFLAPFALLPYAIAFLAWNIGTLFAGIAVVCLIVRRLPAIALVLASPFTLGNIYFGQNGFLTASLLGAGLYFLECRPILAGIFIGCLTYKPQWGLLIPVALVAGKQWRAVASASATALILAGASIIAFGSGGWRLLPHGLIVQTDTVVAGIGHIFSDPYSSYGYVQTVYGLVRRLHGSGAEAWLLQGIASVAAAALVWLVWRARARHALKAATLSAAAFLATPWAFAYDLAALAIPLAFLAADQMRCGLARGEQTTLLALFGLTLAILFCFGGNVPLGPLIAVVLLGLVLRRVRGSPESRDIRLRDGSAVLS